MGPSRPRPSFPRPRATVGALDPGAVTFFLRHRVRGGPGAPSGSRAARSLRSSASPSPSAAPGPLPAAAPPLPDSPPFGVAANRVPPGGPGTREPGAEGGRSVLPACLGLRGQEAESPRVAPPPAGAPGRSPSLRPPLPKGGRSSGLAEAFVFRLRRRLASVTSSRSKPYPRPVLRRASRGPARCQTQKLQKARAGNQGSELFSVPACRVISESSKTFWVALWCSRPHAHYKKAACTWNVVFLTPQTG